MRVLLIAVGTRGDIEPFLAIAVKLKQKGHDILCCFPEQFKKMTCALEIPFQGLGKEFLELLDTEDGKSVMGSKLTFFRKLKVYYHLYRKSSEINKRMAQRQKEIIAVFNPDRVLFHIKSIYPLLWAIEHPNKVVLVSPIPYLVHVTKKHGHIGFNKNYGLFMNKLTYRLSNFALIKNVLSIAKHMDPSNKVSHSLLKGTLLNIKMLYTVSPTLFSKPLNWPDHVRVFGHQGSTTSKIWNMDESLEKFLEKHDKVLFVTFGSMKNDNPEEKTKAILDVVQNYGLPTIVNTSSGGLVIPDNYNAELVYFVSNIPYEHIFPNVHAVIHHGGAGTTHLALKHGCPSLIIPHIIDQYMWANLIHSHGAGPRSISIAKMNSKNLKPKILDLFQNNVYKMMTKQLSLGLKEENYTKELLQFLINK
ncbi:glycosyltransferase [Maribacter sp. HTCC2170]|uniref:glycosyltransferase n=1 Tax=Maribacter sp. (strain HTCC2170 / KCCM 42371) TaxID=313603 RepID=UPI00006AE5DA|nr:glycosyltransferase [Maribacter sp. HTCC2170]EAR00557.1 putative UDP-glucose:sterol glucosyltransferase [Maribacter sp. HTCC2170]